MQRRTLLATLGLASAGGYIGLTSQNQEQDQEQQPEQEQEQEQEQSQDQNATADSNTDTKEPDLSAEDANSTDEPPQERNETTPQEQEQEQDQDTNQSTSEESSAANESTATEDTDSDTTSTPEDDPTDAIEFVEYDVVLDEAQDPNYETDQLYATGTLRNTASHPVVNVRVEGSITVDGDEIAREYTEYARIDPQTKLPLRIDFPYDERAADGQFYLVVSSAEWA